MLNYVTIVPLTETSSPNLYLLLRHLQMPYKSMRDLPSGKTRQKGHKMQVFFFREFSSPPREYSPPPKKFSLPQKDFGTGPDNLKSFGFDEGPLLPTSSSHPASRFVNRDNVNFGKFTAIAFLLTSDESGPISKHVKVQQSLKV